MADLDLEHDPSIRSLTASAIKATAQQLNVALGERLFGYALCTDDEVCSFYHVACTETWISARSADYEEIGYISVEWEQSGDDSLFDELNQLLIRDYENHESDFARHRDKRFESLVLALKDCRDARVFDDATHLSVGGTDPSDHLEFLEMRGIDRINPPDLADSLARALGFEHYRNNNT